jgi:hypothetical protein
MLILFFVEMSQPDSQPLGFSVEPFLSPMSPSSDFTQNVGEMRKVTGAEGFSTSTSSTLLPPTQTESSTNESSNPAPPVEPHVDSGFRFNGRPPPLYTPA